MIDINISLDEAQYHRLEHRARQEGISIEHLVQEMLAEVDAWRDELEDDPITALLGQMDDPLDPNAIDSVLYAQQQQ